MPEERPQLICVTPTRNEAWIIERFLRAAELWADHIVVADQGSTDETVAIARQFKKVSIVSNGSERYDEGQRQTLLLSAARRFSGPRVIIALDADEFLTPNWTESAEWGTALAAEPGAVLAFDWVNVLPPGDRAWVPPQKMIYGFVDDGSEHRGEAIHSTRLPVPTGASVLELDDVKVLHHQYTDWPRMKSKQRWYQCWELLNNQDKRPIQLYRQYHGMDAFPLDQVRALNPAWLEKYAELGIDLSPRASEGPFWWDEDVLHWMLENGPRAFARLDVWDTDWSDTAVKLNRRRDALSLTDPRTRLERAVHRWLRRTQPTAHSNLTRWCQRLLIPLGW